MDVRSFPPPPGSEGRPPLQLYMGDSVLEGDTVHVIHKGVETKGTVLKRAGTRLRVALESGDTSWVELKSLLYVRRGLRLSELN